jgi:BASS family bile acid:Na+ symporter
MLLAASPGGISANLFSHLFGGNLAMNISLTAINTVLSIITLPLIANLAIEIFARTGQVVPLQMGKVIEVIVLILIPVSLGMLARVKAPGFAARMDKPMKIFSALLLLALMGLTLMREWNALVQYFSHLGPAVVDFQSDQSVCRFLREPLCMGWINRWRRPSAMRSASTTRPWPCISA